MKLFQSSKPVHARNLAKWSIPFALLFVLALALTSSAANNAVRAESVPALSKASEARPADPSATPSGKAGVRPSPEMLGLSGRLRAVMGTTETLGNDPVLRPLFEADQEGEESASWRKLATDDGDSFTVVTLVPFGSEDAAEFGKYRVGTWPKGMLTSTARYAPPAGFIGVTEENQATSVSSHFKMRDFLTHDQGDVWPKVLVLRPALLDKLELLRAELEREGLPSTLHVMSGFRTPQYNAKGVGKGGRATHSRHMYGDAADVFVDADGNGTMDDLNKDGKITVADAQVLRAAAERVEAKYPDLVGGLSAYPANSAHGPFVHVDARGVKARW